MTTKIKIYRDCAGNIEIDHYFKESQIPALKNFLTSIGYEVEEEVENHTQSFKRNKPFRNIKPSVQKRFSREVDWLNPNVISFILDNPEIEENQMVRDVVRISGIVAEKDRKATGMVIITGYKKIGSDYEKWKKNKDITESPANKIDLHSQFSKEYTNLKKERIKKKKEKVEKKKKERIKKIGKRSSNSYSYLDEE